MDDQSEVIAFLRDPANHGGVPVDEIETHAAHVFLAGDLVYKLKRAVRFAFLDFSTIDRRKQACEAEIRLNRRTAPNIYRRCVAVTRGGDGTLAIGGEGASVDWLVEMNRFEQSALLDRLAEGDRLDDAVLSELADAIAAFHRAAEERPDKGGRAGLALVIDGNMETLGRACPNVFSKAELDRLENAWLTALEAVGDIAEQRREAGFVRWCHGDLHLRNICLIDGRPTLFDGIEFNEDIACIDVLYDLAFLLMDLRHRGLGAQANLVMNRYLARTEDYAGLALMPLFQSLRAGVRAMVSAIEAEEGQAGLAADARAYLDLAFAYLEPTVPALTAIGGLSGTGKSTLARALAPRLAASPGAVVLRSDMVRKHMYGIAPEDRLPPEAYDRSVNQRVYDRLLELAGICLRAGTSCVVDAVFARAGERAAIADLAGERGAPFTGVWLEAPAPVLRDRVDARARAAADASDATSRIVDRQLDYALGEIDWYLLDASRPTEAVCREVLEIAP
jgi:hypothetical protein